jgi:hypothetical protein
LSQGRPTNAVSRSARLIHWSFAIGGVLLAALGAIVVCGIGTLGDCVYDYKVSVKSASATPIKDVRGKAYYDIERAQEIAADPKARFSTPPNNEEAAFDGNSLRVVGLYSCDTCCLDLIHTGAPPRFLVLIVEYPDGKRENKLVEVPPGSGTQRLAVEVP